MTETSSSTVSVIVPTHHGAHRLPHLLEQLAAQDTTAEWDLVVVVDGVVDDTMGLLRKWQDRLPLTVLVNEEAQGVAAALSRGFAASLGDYLIRCDDDLDIGPKLIARHLAAHEGRRDRVVLSLTRDLFPSTPYAECYGKPANERALEAYYRQQSQYRWQHLAACFSVHRDAWNESGGFDPRFAYGEDSEFAFRLWKRGLEFVIDPALEVGHRGPATSAATRVPRAFVSGASRRLFSAVHPEAVRPARPPLGWRQRAWNALVAAVAFTVRSPKGFRALGRVDDALLGVIPAALGSRLVALSVEASGRSGERYGCLDLHSYRGQKDAEVRSEVRRVSRVSPEGAAALETSESGADK